MADTADSTVLQAELEVADTVGRLMEFWGFKRPMGRIWALLYLSEEPLPAAELGERLAMSAGGVSLALTELQKWGVVKKAWVPGERKEYYEAETSIWKMISRVFRERELVQIREAIETFDGALRELARIGRGRAKFVSDRIEGMKQLAEVAQMLLEAVLEGKRIDPALLKD